MTLVAGALAVLADADLGSPLVRQHLHRHLDAITAEQDIGHERSALVGMQAVDNERLAVADAVLLVSDSDDRVFHRGWDRGHAPAKAAEV